MTDAAFDTVLVANRGEIAVRILRSARAAGYRTVAVYSDADRGAPHVLAADDAVHIGPAPAGASYLDADRLVAAARTSGAQAVHPGYGFLSENADFAARCADEGLTFVGPHPESIRLMGDKAAAKRQMAAAGVPLLPGYTPGENPTDATDERLTAEAAAVGYPLMVKAAAGGGGKGMRLVAGPDGLADALAAARREARSAFGSDLLILERALVRPRHVEIQVLADAHGHTIALGERDCSVQRRHQKVVEEAPSPALDGETRQRMQQAAVLAASDIGYVGAGTVEFLLGEDGTFAFLEMNTRLQVEHPVTELVTGIDLVAWQLRIAAGEPLTITQDDVALSGHAIEVRLYAEDPDNGYLPQTGRVDLFVAPSGDGIRVDAGIATGSEVTSHYDPMLAKVIAHGRDRDEARRRLAAALDRTVLLGVRSNRTFLARILRDRVFAADGATTAFLEERDIGSATVASRDLATVAGWLHHEHLDATAHRSPGLAGWTNAAWLTTPMRLQVNGTATDLDVADRDDGTEITVGDDRFVVTREAGRLRIDGRTVDLDVHRVERDRFLIRLPHLDLEVTDLLARPRATGHQVGAGELLAPMHGSVTGVAVAVGDRVDAGDPVVVMEAMKMEHVVRADVAGEVIELPEVGAQVADSDVLARVRPDPDGEP